MFMHSPRFGQRVKIVPPPPRQLRGIGSLGDAPPYYLSAPDDGSAPYYVAAPDPASDVGNITYSPDRYPSVHQTSAPNPQSYAPPPPPPKKDDGMSSWGILAIIGGVALLSSFGSK